VVASPELPSTKYKCIRCRTVFDIVIRPQYNEFIVRDGAKLCYNCFQKQVQEETRLWQEEQRRDIGPEWEGLPTRKIIPFKKPISMTANIQNVVSSSSSSVPPVESLSSVKGTGVYFDKFSFNIIIIIFS